MKMALKYGAILIPRHEIASEINGDEWTALEQELVKKNGEEKISMYRKYRSYFINHSGFEDYKRRALPLAEKLFSESTTFFALIVRNPISRFISGLQWKGFSSSQIKKRIDELRESCPYFESDGCGPLIDQLPCPELLTNKSICVDGFYSVFNEARAMSYIRKFDLVMVTEKMSESIVLLAEMLAYSVEQIGTVKLKSCEQKFYNYTEEELSVITKAHKAETLFYNLVNQEFERRKKELDPIYLGNQVLKLQEANEYTKRVCEYQYIYPNRTKNETQSKFSINVEKMLKNPQVMMECLPLVFDSKNNIRSDIMKSTLTTHEDNSKLLNSGETNLCYPYSSLSFYNIFKKSFGKKLSGRSSFY